MIGGQLYTIVISYCIELLHIKTMAMTHKMCVQDRFTGVCHTQALYTDTADVRQEWSRNYSNTYR